MADDPRFEVPETLRHMGIFGGLIMMALGLFIGWVQSGRPADLAPTGVPPKPTGGEGAVDRLLNALADKIVGGGKGGTP